jgi:hypothetical protein
MQNKYTDEQLTTWICGRDLPSHPGFYEIKTLNSKQIVNGSFREGRWYLEFKGELSPLSFARMPFEWRGLNFEPKVLPRRSGGLVIINGKIVS